jgi:hypothetical protein
MKSISRGLVVNGNISAPSCVTTSLPAASGPAKRDSNWARRRSTWTGVRLGVLTPNEARADFYGKRPIDGGDALRPLAGRSDALHHQDTKDIK